MIKLESANSRLKSQEVQYKEKLDLFLQKVEYQNEIIIKNEKYLQLQNASFQKLLLAIDCLWKIRQEVDIQQDSYSERVVEVNTPSTLVED